jgi:hypothetical protein
LASAALHGAERSTSLSAAFPGKETRYRYHGRTGWVGRNSGMDVVLKDKNRKKRKMKMKTEKKKKEKRRI